MLGDDGRRVGARYRSVVTIHLRPPSYRRLQPVHWLVVDAVVAGSVAVLLLTTLRWHPPGRADPVSMTAVLALLATVPVAVRRRRPVVVLGVVVIAGALLSAERVLPVPSVVPIGPALVLYCVAERLPRRRSLFALLVALVVAAVAAGAGAVFALLPMIAGWVVGLFVRQQRSYASWRRAQETARAVTDERLRLARELHDVVSHSMSAIAVRAGVANHVADEKPAEARQALGDIEAISRSALRELRQMLGLLRAGPGEAGAALPPVPGLDQLGRLAADVSRSGVDVDVRTTGEPGPVPPGVALAVYRIIQEALTNVVRHADAERSTVTLGYRPCEVSVEIVDDGRLGPAGRLPGHGLIGMRERVGLHGGEFSAGPQAGGGFRVYATIPLKKGEQ